MSEMGSTRVGVVQPILVILVNTLISCHMFRNMLPFSGLLERTCRSVRLPLLKPGLLSCVTVVG